MKDMNINYMCIRSFRNFQPLTKNEEYVIIKLAKSGDRRARNVLINCNMRFVIKVCRNYSNYNVSYSDLISEGCRGLSYAIDRFDPETRFKFISYAVWWVRQHLQKYVSENRYSVAIPANRCVKHRKTIKKISNLEAKLGRKATLRDKEEHIKGYNEPNYINPDTQYMPLDGPIHDLKGGVSGCLAEIIEDEYAENPEKNALKPLMAKKVRQMLDILTEKERRMVVNYYGIGMETSYTYHEIGEMEGVTRERVRQIIDKCKIRLKKRFILTDPISL